MKPEEIKAVIKNSKQIAMETCDNVEFQKIAFQEVMKYYFWKDVPKNVVVE